MGLFLCSQCIVQCWHTEWTQRNKSDFKSLTKLFKPPKGQSWSWVIFSLVAQTVKESACSAGDQNSIPGLGTSPREGNGHPLEYSWSMGPWVHGSQRVFLVHGSQRVRHNWATNTHTRVRFCMLLLSTSSVVQENSVNTFLSCFSEHKLSPL